jgi:calcineurin-like phosphoesterase family protein
MPNIFFTSDTHYHHKNIVRGCSSWEGANEQNTRDFDTLEEHDEILVQNINKTVKENDILYHLGDWSFGGLAQIWEFRKRLLCKNIHLVLGNHDHHIANNREITLYTGNNELGVFNTITYCQTLFNSVNQYIMNKKIGGQEMCLSHFAQRVWDKSHHGNWNLYGHSHGTLSTYSETSRLLDMNGNEKEIYETGYEFKCMDVGVDTHPEFRPYHFDEIADIMKHRVYLKVDHHNEKTN